MPTDDARADLAYIRRLMEDTRRATYVSGGYFIVWGAVIGLGVILTWLQLRGTLPPMGMWTWTGCLALGGFATFWLVQLESREPVEAPAGRLIGTVWMSMGITMMIIFFVGVGSGQLHGAHMPALSSALIGGAMFLTGTLAGLRWLRNIALGWWGGAAAMLAWPGMHVLLMMGLMLIALYVIPGAILIRMQRAARKGTVHG